MSEPHDNETPAVREAAEQVCDYLAAWNRGGDPLDLQQAVMWAVRLRIALDTTPLDSENESNPTEREER